MTIGEDEDMMSKRKNMCVAMIALSNLHAYTYEHTLTRSTRVHEKGGGGMCVCEISNQKK